MHVRRWAFAAAAVVVCLIGSARADDCILDNCADKRGPAAQPRSDNGRGGGSGYNSGYNRGSGYDRGFRRNGYGPRGASIPGQFDFYVFSLSWSPGFCATGGDEKGRDQCRTGSGMGFTVHGLWPQYDHGFPSDCNGSGRYPSRMALQETDGVYPDEGLARYEWRKHGTCSGLSPNDYFAAAKQARDAIVVPPQLKDPHQAQSMAPLEVEHAFTEANPRLRPGMVAAVCKDGTLDEVRFCFTKDLKSFQVCPEVVRQRCRSQSMSIPPVR